MARIKIFELPIPIPVFFVILFFSFLMVFLSDKLLIDQPINSYHHFNNNAHWIKSKAASEESYYIKPIHLSEKPIQAFITVSATDSFNFYVNGILAGGKNYLGGKPVATYDVHHLLKAGPNVLAAKVVSNSSGINSHLISEMVYKTTSGTFNIYSDSSWLSTNHFPIVQYLVTGNPLYWYQNGYASHYWGNAILATSYDNLSHVPNNVMPKQLAQFNKSLYLWDKDNLTPHLTIENSFFLLDIPVESANLGVSVDGYYKIKVNGYDIVNNKATTSQVVLHDIGRYLKSKNTIAIDLFSAGFPKRAAVYGNIVYKTGQMTNISTDANWVAADNKRNEGLVFFKPDKNIPKFTTVANTSAPFFYFNKYIGFTMNIFVVGVFIVLIGQVLVSFLAESTHCFSYWQWYCYPYVIACIVMLGVIFVIYDPDFVFYIGYLKIPFIFGIFITFISSVILLLTASRIDKKRLL
ncbi:hypothetical protein JCM14076_15510 [Methylosoma difficile]